MMMIMMMLPRAKFFQWKSGFSLLILLRVLCTYTYACTCISDHYQLVFVSILDVQFNTNNRLHQKKKKSL